MGRNLVGLGKDLTGQDMVLHDTGDLQMKVVGITGGVGAGKSTILEVLEKKFGARVLVADEIAHDLMEPGTECNKKLRELFPKDVFDDKGNIVRPKMAECIFGDESYRIKMNEIVHPNVGQFFKDAIEEERAGGKRELVVIEAALFNDTDNDKLCDALWYVDTSDEVRAKRLMDSRGYSKEKTAAIMESQKAEVSFKDKADAVIKNDGDLEDTLCEVRKALGILFEKNPVELLKGE